MLYRVTVVYTDERCKNQVGGNMLVNAESKEEAGEKGRKVFTDILKTNGFGNVTFDLEINKSSLDEAEEYLKNLKNNQSKMVC